jgi:hypothetical protein
MTYVDDDVKPGGSYSYRIRTIGENTTPKAGAWTDDELVKVEPDVDFRFTRSSREGPGCEVAKRAGGLVQKDTFMVAVGQEIGGVEEDRATGRTTNLLTGEYLVDFHRSIYLEGEGVTDRLIYADSEGNLHERLRGESEAKDLWKSAAAAGSRRMGVPGMPPGVVPTGPGMGYRPRGM